MEILRKLCALVFPVHGKWPHTSRQPHTSTLLTHAHTQAGLISGSIWMFYKCNSIVFFLVAPPEITSTLKFHKPFSHRMSCGSSPGCTSHARLHSSALSVGSVLFFPFSLRAFPLPCRPKPSFRPVIPVNLMLKLFLQQSITAKTTERSLPAG